MPLDFTDPPTIIPPTTLHNLSYLIRNKELWPKGFVWNYSSCGNCAMGLVLNLLGNKDCWGLDRSVEEMKKIFGIDECTAIEIFANQELLFGGIQPRHGANNIPPEQIADLIDHYLAKEATNPPQEH